MRCMVGMLDQKMDHVRGELKSELETERKERKKDGEDLNGKVQELMKRMEKAEKKENSAPREAGRREDGNHNMSFWGAGSKTRSGTSSSRIWRRCGRRCRRSCDRAS